MIAIDTDIFWYWTYRYHDNDELAILVANIAGDHQSRPAIMTSDITILIREENLLRTTRKFRAMWPASTNEWKTWAAFELCPVIEVYLDKDDEPRWRRIEL